MERKTVWNEAGLPGLIVGGIPVLCFALNQLKSDSMAFNAVLWILKFGTCVYLLYFFMKKFYLEHDDACRSDIFRFGVAIALFSSIICAGCQLGYVLLVKPDFYETTINTVLNSGMGAQLDSNSLSAIEELLPKLPTITFFCNLVYCFLFGLVASAIISGSLISSNPFNEDER